MRICRAKYEKQSFVISPPILISIHPTEVGRGVFNAVYAAKFEVPLCDIRSLTSFATPILVTRSGCVRGRIRLPNRDMTLSLSAGRPWSCDRLLERDAENRHLTIDGGELPFSNDG